MDKRTSLKQFLGIDGVTIKDVSAGEKTTYLNKLRSLLIAERHEADYIDKMVKRSKIELCILEQALIARRGYEEELKEECTNKGIIVTGERTITREVSIEDNKRFCERFNKQTQEMVQDAMEDQIEKHIQDINDSKGREDNG